MSLADFSALLTNPDQFGTAVFEQLRQLGDPLAAEDATALALFMLELYKNDTPRDKAEAEMADMLTSAGAFTAWVYEYLDGEKRKLGAANTKKRTAPDLEPEASGETKAQKDFKVKKIVWEDPAPAAPKKEKPVAAPPAKRVALDSEEQKKLRMARFGIVEEEKKSVPHPKQTSVGIVGRGSGSATSVQAVRPGIAARLGPQPSSGSGKGDDGDHVHHNQQNHSVPQPPHQSNQYSTSQNQNQNQSISNERNQFQQPQNSFGGQQQQQWSNHNQNNGFRQNSNFNNFNNGNFNNNHGFQNQQRHDNFQRSGVHQLQQGMMPTVPNGFFMDSYGNLVPTMNVGQNMGGGRGGFGMQQRGRGGFSGYNNSNQSFRGNFNGGLRGGFRGASNVMGGTRPAFNNHQEHQLPTNPNSAEDPSATSGGEEGQPTGPSLAESEDGGAEIVIDAAPSGEGTSAPTAGIPAASFAGGYQQQQAFQQQQQQPAPCRFGAGCTRYGCIFLHPWDAQVQTQQQRQCRFWPNCINPVCPFFHPGPTTPAGAATDISSVPCKFDGYCTKPGCPFKHSKSKTAVFNGATSSHISERAFAADEAEKVLPEGVVDSKATPAAAGAGDSAVATESSSESKITAVIVGGEEELIDEDALL
ncbi:hypothetical protein BDR26DRAFT_849098 [Obelidium mucronatum]|nr:hypothetical protein BDR26DRAFT_849098 [Obelidium mucronatum]